MGAAVERLSVKLARIRVPVVGYPRHRGGKLERVEAHFRTVDVGSQRSTDSGSMGVEVRPKMTTPKYALSQAQATKLLKKHHLPKGGWNSSGRVKGWGSSSEGFELETERRPFEFDPEAKQPDHWLADHMQGRGFAGKRYFQTGSTVYRHDATYRRKDGSMGTKLTEMLGEPTGRIRVTYRDSSYIPRPENRKEWERKQAEREAERWERLKAAFREEGYKVEDDGQGGVWLGDYPLSKQDIKNAFFDKLWSRADFKKLDAELPGATDKAETMYDNILDDEGKPPTHARLVRDLRRYYAEQGLIDA